VWDRDLLSQVRKQLPRWRWKSSLRRRGGLLEGTSQKSSIRFGVTYLRSTWVITVWLYVKKRWINYDTTETRSLADLVLLIQESCGI
jgi:hypothetical protein